MTTAKKTNTRSNGTSSATDSRKDLATKTKNKTALRVVDVEAEPNFKVTDPARRKLFSEAEWLALSLLSDSYGLDDDGKPSPCGHTSISEALDRAIQDLEVIQAALGNVVSRDDAGFDSQYAVYRVACRLEWLRPLVRRFEVFAGQVIGKEDLDADSIRRATSK